MIKSGITKSTQPQPEEETKSSKKGKGAKGKKQQAQQETSSSKAPKINCPITKSQITKTLLENKVNELLVESKKIRQSLFQAPKATMEMMNQARVIQQELDQVNIAFNENKSISKRSGNQAPSINSRLENTLWANYSSTSDITTTQKEQRAIIEQLYKEQLLHRNLIQILHIFQKHHHI